MRATLHLGEFPDEWAIALEALVRENERLIRSRGLPSLYDIPDLRFVPEAGEEWRNALEVYTSREGDCEDLAAYRAAELRVQGIPASVGIVRSGPGRYHAIVMLPDGHIEDPAKLIRNRDRRRQMGLMYEIGQLGCYPECLGDEGMHVAILGAPAMTPSGAPAVAWWYGWGATPQQATQMALQQMASTPRSTMAIPYSSLPLSMPGQLPAQYGAQSYIPMASPQQAQQMAQLMAMMAAQRGMMPGYGMPGMMPGYGMPSSQQGWQQWLSTMARSAGTQLMMTGDPASMAAGAGLWLLSQPQVQQGISDLWGWLKKKI